MLISKFFCAFTLIFLFAAVSSFGQTVPDNSADIKPLGVGNKMPDVTVRNSGNESVSLTNLVSGKKTVLIFYRAGWCPFCNRHLMNLRKIENDLAALGYQLIAIGADSPEKLKETMTNDTLSYIVLSDYNAEASTAFGVAFRLDDNAFNAYKKNDMDLDKISGNTKHILPVPSVFLIDKEGIIKFQHSNPNFIDRLDNDKILEEARKN
jgi:peroxiredoxin